MKRLKVLFRQGWLGQQHGGVMVEFAIILPVLLLLVFGVIDFGHALYMKAEITAASREGARYAVKYHTDNNGTPVKPCNLTGPTVEEFVINAYASLLPSDAELKLNPPPTGSGYTSGNPGEDVIISVQATKNWWVIGALTGMSPLTLQSTTVMKCE